MTETTQERISAASEKALLRRGRIVAAARRLFIANGFHATGVAQIAKESGIAVGQIYRDFSSKEAIVAAIVEVDCVDFLAHDTLRRGLDSGNIEVVWTWLGDFLDVTPDESDPLFAEIVAESSRNERIAAIFEQTREAVRATMLAALAALAPGDEFAERRVGLSELILAMSLGLMQHRFLSDPNDTTCAAELAFKMIRTEIAAMQAERATA
jgi:AcrR family transcriptional regulator